MICISCEEELTHGYFQKTEEGIMVICTECLLRYDKYRKIVRKNKYDHEAIYKMHTEGYCDKTIATYFGTNPLTVGKIIRDIEREKCRIQSIKAIQSEDLSPVQN